MINYDLFAKIGLTKQESNVYLSLLELREAQTGKLCKQAKIASSNIYPVLDSLIHKGLASFKVQNNIKVFMPSPLETLNDLISEKQKKLEQEREELGKVIMGLKAKEKQKEQKANYKYFEGLAGIKSMWHEINSSMSREDVFRVYTGKRMSYGRMVGFLDEHHSLRVRKKVKELMILPKEDKELACKRKRQLATVKFMDLRNDAEWGVWKDLFYMHYYPVKKAPRGFLVQDEVFAQTFAQVFDQLWWGSKKSSGKRKKKG